MKPLSPSAEDDYGDDEQERLAYRMKITQHHKQQLQQDQEHSIDNKQIRDFIAKQNQRPTLTAARTNANKRGKQRARRNNKNNNSVAMSIKIPGSNLWNSLNNIIKLGAYFPVDILRSGGVVYCFRRFLKVRFVLVDTYY